MADAAVGPLLAGLVRCFAPLPALLGDEGRFAGFVRSLDPTVRLDVDALAAVISDLAAPATAIALAVDQAAAADGLRSSDAATRAEAADTLLAAAVTVAEELAGVADVVLGWDLGELGLAAEHRSPAFWADLLAAAFDRLVVEAIEQQVPVLHGLAILGGVIVEAPDGTVELRLDALGPAIADLPGTVAGQAGWGRGKISLDWLTGPFSDAVAAFGLSGRVRTLRPALAELLPARQPTDARALEVPFVSGFQRPLGALAELGVIVAAASAGGGTPPDALLVANLAWGASSVTVTSPGGWRLAIAGTAELSGALALLLEPDRATDLGDGATGSLIVSVAKAADPPWRPFGTPTSTRLAVGSAEAGIELVVGPAPEVVVTAGIDDAEVVVTAGSPFLATLLGAEQIAAPFALELRWSSTSGFSIAGDAGVRATVQLDREVGPIHLDRLELAAVVGGGDGEPGTAVELSARLFVTAALGPFTFGVDGIGFAFSAGPADDGLDSVGPLGLGARFLPPSGLGVSVEAPLTSGGGRLAGYPETGRYEGALAIDIAAVGIQAMTVIDSAVAGEPGGWTFFASLTARFPGIPLGFGFTLTGVGGLLALNRAVDSEALALGLRDGAADAVLFPDDPVGDAAVLFGQLDEYFPPAAGNTVIGPVIEVGWGTPTIITAQLGVLISVPQDVITVLGSLSANLPVPDDPVLELQMDAVGIVDVPGGTVLVTASLYDSRLLGAIELSGDVGLYVSTVEDPYFVLSVGGYHPGFRPPAHVPAALEELRRMRAGIDLGAGVAAAITAYFAVTSNSVQFGGGFELEASAEFLSVTYSARGWFEFDVLLQFHPFALIADVSAGVGVYAGAKELLGVELSAHLEGPEPWFATASGRFRFFFVNVKFDVTVGAHAAPALPDTVDALALMTAELAHPEAWSVRHPTTAPAGLVLRPDITNAFIRPDDSVVVVQSVAPLGQRLDRLGELTPVQTEVHVAAATVVDGATGDALADLTVEDVLGWFAPAYFQSMRDEARLSSPSYEQHPAGVCFGAGGVAVPDDVVAVPPGHETEVWQPSTGLVKGFGVVRTVATRDIILATSTTARVVAAWLGAKVATEAVTVTPTRYAVVDATTGLPAAGGGATTRVVPAHALAVSLP